MTYRVTLPEGCEATFKPSGREQVTLGGVAQMGPLALGFGTHEIGFTIT